MVQGFSLLSVSTNLRSLRAVLHRFGSEALGSSAPPLNRSVRHQVADTGLPVPVRSGVRLHCRGYASGVLVSFWPSSKVLHASMASTSYSRLKGSSGVRPAPLGRW